MINSAATMEYSNDSAILDQISVSDAPVEKLPDVEATGTIQEVTLTPTKSGRFDRVSVKLQYTDANANERYLTLRWLHNADWTSRAFTQRFTSGSLDNAERISYQMNFQKRSLKLFKAAGLSNFDFNALVGHTVKFKAQQERKKVDDGYAPKYEAAYFAPVTAQ